MYNIDLFNIYEPVDLGQELYLEYYTCQFIYFFDVFGELLYIE